jgi:YesN/AraC family two-component response regulator
MTGSTIAAGIVSDARPLCALLDRCQSIVGRFGYGSRYAVICDIRRLIAEVPASMPRVEQIVVTNTLNSMLARFMRLNGVDKRTDIVNRFLRLTDHALDFGAWRSDWVGLVARCAVLVHDNVRYRTIDARASSMLDLIDARHVDPRLTMRAIAQTLHLCHSQATRILKQQTGYGFSAHLHSCRIKTVQRLLTDSSLSIKEIAAAVGYAHPSQLSRRFKLACGETPIAFRANSINRRISA